MTCIEAGAKVKRGFVVRALPIVLTLLVAPAVAEELPTSRQFELVRMVRQDCGSCHGMRLTGGLGPALTRAALADKPVEGLAATIYFGRPGTPMPGWRSMLSQAESAWIAEQLMSGFPEERRAQR
jgi:cytochrome c55X